MKILVTGGAGFIGSNIVDALISAGHEIAIIDNLSTGKEENINLEVKFYNVDLGNKLKKYLEEILKTEVVRNY